MRRRHRRTCGSRCASYIPVYPCYPERARGRREREKKKIYHDGAEIKLGEKKKRKIEGGSIEIACA